MKTSIATVSISGDLAEKMEAIAAAGFDGIEIFENDFLAYDASPREIGTMARSFGLEISLFQPFRDFEGMPHPQRDRAFDRAERKFDVMNELGADLLLVCSNCSPLALGGKAQAAKDLWELGKRAEARGIKIGYEALAWGKHISDHRDAWDIVRRADRKNIGIILDSFHTLSKGIDPDTIRSIPGDKIFFVQLADAPKIDMDLLHWSRHYRNMPGEGDLDVTGFMRAVAATGYDGPLSLEIFNDQFRGGSAKTIAADGHRSLIYLADTIRRQETDCQIDLADFPDRSHSEGVEFIEFTGSEDDRSTLAEMLRQLGFQRTGRHVSKDVDHWRQKDINIVLNTEKEGFAHSSYIVHGANVCDIGLKVKDAKATINRAEALGAVPYSKAVKEGELEIPAVRGVGGGLLHFIDSADDLGRVWEIEFEPVEDEGETTHPTGLLRIDHIAQTMSLEEMPTWLLFYTSILETHKTPTIDVVDPAGLVRSQAIENQDGSLRLTLNGAENRRTLAGHFINENFGAAVQHLAFATQDIFATAKALKGNGFTPISISRNYFDDLDARFGLEDELLDALKEFGILYDRDENGGEYFQLYSPLYREGFFFEIVERRGGYNGYGASNAQFRIAAQKRHMRHHQIPKK